MVKSYMKLIGIFQGKQEKHNKQILSILYDNGPLTAWEITGKIQKVGKVSLHATLYKRLRSLEEKGYLNKAGKKWCLQFKGIIAAILIQKTPKALSNKWADVVDFYAKQIEEHFSGLSEMTVQAFGVAYQPLKGMDKSTHTVRTFDEWAAISDLVKGLMEKGVINFDLISNENLFAFVLMEAARKATDEQLEDFIKDWNFKVDDKSAGAEERKKH